MTVEIRPMEERDRDRVVALHAQAFQVPEFRLARQRTMPLEKGWVITRAGQVVGGLRVDLVGQYFGGRSVPCAAIASVKLAPEARGTGLGQALMTEVVRHLAATGVALSTLYPSGPRLYRRLGYEIAGVNVRYRVPRAELPAKLTETIEPWTPDDEPAVRSCYRRFAERENGPIDRGDAWWSEWIVDPYLDRPTYRFLLRDGGTVRGYLVFGQSPDLRSDLPYAAAVHCIDLVWDTPATARALLGFLGVQGPLVSTVSWSGPPNDPLMTLLGTQAATGSSGQWMTRVLAPGAALEGRGYPSHVAETLGLSIVDDTLPANTRVLTLTVANGKGTVRPNGDSEAELEVRGLALLYTARHRAAEIIRLGLLRGASVATQAKLDLIFGGPSPWMAEVF